MRTSTVESTDGKLLVDPEAGRVLRADDYVIVSQRYLDSHPFIEQTGALVRAGAYEPGRVLECVDFEVVREVAGFVHLQKIED